MNTTAAAAQAGVTVSTIRTWCRVGAVAATKQAGRWNIDPTSLNHRIAIGARRTRKPAEVVFSVETMTAIGGSRWQKAGHDRVYLNNWHAFAGLEYDSYRSGSIRWIALDGRSIANNRAGRILGAVARVYFDAADGLLHFQHNGADDLDVRYLDGERDTVDLLDRITAGIRSAIAAL